MEQFSQASFQVEEVPPKVTDTAVYKVIEELGNNETLSQKQVEKYLKKLFRLHDGIMKSQANEQMLNRKVAQLKNELSNQKDQIKQSETTNFEDNTSVTSLRKELQRASQELTNCSIREDQERQQITELENNRKQLEDAIEVEKNRKVSELEPKIRQLKAATAELKDEINEQNILFEKYHQDRILAEKEIEAHQLQVVEQDDQISELKQEYSKIRMDPEKYRKQADVSLTTLSTLRVEEERLKNYATELETELNNKSKKRKEDLDQSMSLAVELDKYRNLIKKKESECRDIMKSSELEQIKHREEIENRSKLEGDLKRMQMRIRRKNEEFMGKERETVKALKNLRRAKYALEVAKKSVPALQHRIDEMKRELEKEVGLAKKQHFQLEDSRCETYILISNQLHLEDMEAKVSQYLTHLLIQVEEQEQQLNRLMKQEISLNREINDISVERDMRRNESVRAIGSFDKARKDLKLKNLVIVDLERAFADTDANLKKFEELYEVVKNERNRYSNALQATQLLGAELAEKIKILQNEIDLLQNETQTKDKVILQERTTYQSICMERDAARGEINKSTYSCQLKEEGVEQGMAEIQKLNAIIKTAESEMLSMRQKYESSLDNLNASGIQFVRLNEELCLMYEKSNIQENALRTGQIEYKKREEEIRILNLHISELEREIHVARKHDAIIPKLQQEKEDLMKLLLSKQHESRKLSFEIESPDNGRWRTLSGKDPSSDELVQRILSLEKRITMTEDKLLEKEVIIQKARAALEKKKQSLESIQEGAEKVISQVNEYKSRIKKLNRKTQSVLAQVSLNQTTCMKFQQEKVYLEQDLKDATIRMDKGEAPTIEAERKWLQSEQMRIQKEMEQDMRHSQEIATQSQTAVSSTGMKSQAEARINMYIPENDPLQLPKPFLQQQFKPSEKGSTMRHIRQPKAKDISITI